jgi:hypothetical protein
MKCEVELQVRHGKVMTCYQLKQEKSLFRAQVVLLPEGKGTGRLTVEATFNNGSLTGSINDGEIEIGGKAYKLSSIRSISPANG